MENFSTLSRSERHQVAVAADILRSIKKTGRDAAAGAFIVESDTDTFERVATVAVLLRRSGAIVTPESLVAVALAAGRAITECPRAVIPRDPD